MSFRYQVIRSLVKHRGQVFMQGELLPENFTERDRARNVYSRRIVRVEVPDDPILPQENEEEIKPVEPDLPVPEVVIEGVPEQETLDVPKVPEPSEATKVVVVTPVVAPTNAVASNQSSGRVRTIHPTPGTPKK